MHADVIKVGALGSDGELRIGIGSISADTTLQLYAPGSNGEVIFVANVSLSGSSTKSIAGNAVTILNGVNVQISGPAASVYVNSTNGVPNANYMGYGGNNTTTGTFTRPAGDSTAPANAPKPLDQAPPFGPPPGG